MGLAAGARPPWTADCIGSLVYPTYTDYLVTNVSSVQPAHGVAGWYNYSEGGQTRCDRTVCGSC
jgi:hypothetical protein